MGSESGGRREMTIGKQGWQLDRKLGSEDKVEPLSVSHNQPHRWPAEASVLHHGAAQVPCPGCQKLKKRDPAEAKGAGSQLGCMANKWGWSWVTTCKELQWCLGLWTDIHSEMEAASLHLAISLSFSWANLQSDRQGNSGKCTSSLTKMTQNYNHYAYHPSETGLLLTW